MNFLTRFIVPIVLAAYLIIVELPLLNHDINNSISPSVAGFFELKRQIAYFLVILLAFEISAYFSPSDFKKQADVFLFRLLINLANGVVFVIVLMRLFSRQ
jgi:hypothetical protein